jgi:hypothetical protein
MKSRWILWSVPLLLLAASCAPVARTVPAEPAVAYAGSPTEVFDAVREAITTAPALDDSTGWVVTYSDAAQGSIIAETDVTTPAWFLRPASTRTERVTVVITPTATGSQVVLQWTTGAESLAERIENVLLSAFGRN